MAHTLKLDANASKVVLHKPLNGPVEQVSYVLPIVNLNGASARDLMEQQLEVKRALDKLNHALREACPHPRDFQLSPEGDYDKAMAIHREELDVVSKLYIRHDAMLEGIYQQTTGE